MDLNCEYSQLVAKSSDGELKNYESKITEPEYEVLRFELADRHVRKL